MSGYLQRLLDAAAPASDLPAMTPVVKSTSPIFEQNQLLGLANLHPGAGDPELAPPVADVPSLRAPIRSAAAPAVPPLEITGRHPQPVITAPWPDLEPGPMVVEPLPLRPAAAPAAMPPPHEPPDVVLEPMRPDPETFGPAPEGAEDAPAAPTPREHVSMLMDAERVVIEATPSMAPEAFSQAEPQERPAAPPIVTRDAPRVLEPSEGIPDAPVPPSVLEPRPRPDIEPAAAHPQPEMVPTPPRITIGRVTVELVPDDTPAARPAGAPRTAEAASMIGPLGDRRARRRLFALSRL